MESTRLGFRTSLVTAVSHDGGLRLAGLARERTEELPVRVGLVRDSSDTERHVVRFVFWTTPARLGVCRDRDFVDIDRGHDLAIL